MTGISITAVAGLPEVTPGADLPALVEAAEPDLRDGDILVITSKVISKAEGRLVRADRDQAIDAETVRMVARPGRRLRSAGAGWLAVLAAATSFALTSPFVVLHLGVLARDVATQTLHLTGGHHHRHSRQAVAYRTGRRRDRRRRPGPGPGPPR